MGFSRRQILATVRARFGFGHDRSGANAIARTLAMLGFTESVKGAESPAWLEPWAAPVPGAVIVGAGVNITEACGAF